MIAFTIPDFKVEYVSINNSPIEVSGSNLNKRVEKIETIVKSLVKVTGRTKKSKLAQELDKLEENRKKILLLVGSCGINKWWIYKKRRSMFIS